MDHYLNTSVHEVLIEMLRSCWRLREPHGSIKMRTSSSSCSIFRILIMLGWESLWPLVSLMYLEACLMILTATYSSIKEKINVSENRKTNYWNLPLYFAKTTCPKRPLPSRLLEEVMVVLILETNSSRWGLSTDDTEEAWRPKEPLTGLEKLKRRQGEDQPGWRLLLLHWAKGERVFLLLVFLTERFCWPGTCRWQFGLKANRRLGLLNSFGLTIEGGGKRFFKADGAQQGERDMTNFQIIKMNESVLCYLGALPNWICSNPLL